MFNRSAALGMAFAGAWLHISLTYYLTVYLPPKEHVAVGWVCAVIAGSALAILPARLMILKVFVVSFASATALSSLQVSYSQPALSADFLTFLTLHLAILGAAIGTGEYLAGPRPEPPLSPAALANLAVYAFVAVGVFVALTKGVRLSAFLEGNKLVGDAFKVRGLSGIQGVLSVFVLCGFSLLSRTNKVLFAGAVVAFAIMDVKRGELIRVILFLLFWAALAAPRRVVWMVGIGAAVALALFVVGGEVRQALYSSGFSISDMMQSRIGNTAVDWVYGYFGITVSVLQEHFLSATPPPGYFPTLMGLLLNTGGPPASDVSIHGFNAGTALSLFAGQETIGPSVDFLLFCVMVAFIVAWATWLGTPSLLAFVLLQVFGFVFGNQLMLPAYLLGFVAAAGYQTVLALRRD